MCKMRVLSLAFANMLSQKYIDVDGSAEPLRESVQRLFVMRCKLRKILVIEQLKSTRGGTGEKKCCWKN